MNANDEHFTLYDVLFRSGSAPPGDSDPVD